MVHGTMVTLKAEATSSSGAAYVDAARRFFSLQDTPAAYLPAQTGVQDMTQESSDGNGANRFSEASLVQHTTKEQSRRVS